MASGWNLWVWLADVVVKRYIDILIIIITFPTPLVLALFFSSSIPTSLFIFQMFFRLIFRPGILSCIKLTVRAVGCGSRLLLRIQD